MKKLSLQILQALTGDSIFVSYMGSDNKEHHILIDGGMPNTFLKSIKNIIKNIDCLDYIFITHIDRDHIGGILKLLDSSYKNKIQHVFLNSGYIVQKQDDLLISENDGKNLINYINKSDTIKSNKNEITTKTIFNFFGLEISFLSPTYKALKFFNDSYSVGKIKEEALISKSIDIDTDLNFQQLSKMSFTEKGLKQDASNGVSLAILIKYIDNHILLLGDAKDSILIETLKINGYKNKRHKRLEVDYIKLSHHGSKYHTSNDFLSLVECQNFIISTNGKGNSCHPHIEVFARILCHPNRNIKQKIFFYFNYPKKQYIDSGIRLLTSLEEDKYHCKCIYDKTLFEVG